MMIIIWYFHMNNFNLHFYYNKKKTNVYPSLAILLIINNVKHKKKKLRFLILNGKTNNNKYLIGKVRNNFLFRNLAYRPM